MSKDKWNLLVNVLLYLVGCGIVSTGCLLYFVLLPGSRGGHGLALLGLSRHEWGDIHFYLAIAITALTVLHLVLNWSWIVVTVRRYLPGRDKGMGTAGAAVLVLLLLVGVGLLVTPFALTVERGVEGESRGGQGGYGNRGGRGGEGGQADRVEAGEPGADASPQAAKEVPTE
jgi:hypothetical protein